MNHVVRRRQLAGAILGLAAVSVLHPAASTAQDASPPVADTRPGPGSLMTAIIDSVSADRIEADIRRLAGFGTRNTMSDTMSDTRGIGAARRWIATEFGRTSAACGYCLKIDFQTSVVTGARRMPDSTVVVNVIAVQRGTTDPDRYVIMSGDIDSRASDGSDAVTDAPGANDNASGMAGVLEAARVLSRYEFPATIVYVGLSGEEQGLFGGQKMAAEALAAGWRIEAVLNNDMIGNIQGQSGVVDNTVARVFSEGIRADETDRMATIRRYTGGEVDSPSRNLARYVDRMADLYIPNLDIMMVYRLDRFGRGGHHRPFNDVGYPAVRIMETNEDYRRQHQDVRVEDGVEYGDVVEEVEFDFAAKLTALNAVTLASLARAPAPPSAVEIEGAVRPSTTLRWQPVDPAVAPHLAGYRVYWRLTDQPQWQWSEFTTGTELTLENVVIDNYIFGVASVAEGGFESPVVFPGSIGAFAPAAWTMRDVGGER